MVRRAAALGRNADLHLQAGKCLWYGIRAHTLSQLPLSSGTPGGVDISPPRRGSGSMHALTPGSGLMPSPAAPGEL